VNGRPAKGLHMTCATRMGFSPNPRPGFGIADATINQGRQQCNWELLSPDGQFGGRLVDGGFYPHTVLGGAGAYFGLSGEHVSAGTSRSTSVAEDPSMRRINRGGSGKATFYVVPRFWPQVLVEPEGPAVFHADDWSRVTTQKPARPGELLMMWAKGLSPTRPALIPPGVEPFATEPPYEQVNSPLDVFVNGAAAEVVNAIGWPVPSICTGSISVFQPEDGPAPLRSRSHPPGLTRMRLRSGFSSARARSLRAVVTAEGSDRLYSGCDALWLVVDSLNPLWQGGLDAVGTLA
jgi:hypothetical protein